MGSGFVFIQINGENRRKWSDFMKTRHLFTRVLSMALVCVMLLGFLPATVAAEGESVKTNGNITWEKTDEIYKQDLSDRLAEEVENLSEYKDTDVVRVSIILKAASTLAKGFKAENISGNSAAMSYRASLKSAQASIEKTISEKVLGGEKLDVVWNLTLAANLISANVPFGKIEAIKAISGVEDVVIERSYAPCVTEIGGADPQMATSGTMIGSYTAWAEGYTGAGSRIAVIDTGTDTNHQSFDASAYEYALEQNAAKLGKSVADYKASLNLLDAEEIAGVWSQLNFASRCDVDSAELYLTSKLPFAANYVDRDLDVTHDNDSSSEHGSHVAGIATANRFIPNGSGFDYALDSVKTQGVAPDAQLITMKVFGKKGGAYDSDYMVAIEDAIVLNADAINLSLGSGNPGLSRTSAAYEKIMNDIAKSGTVVSISAGNSGYWAENATYGYLYSDAASFDTVGSPGSFTNSLSVASVDNDGATGAFFKVDGKQYFYSESSGYKNQPMASIAGDYDYIFFNNTLADGDGNSMIDDFADVINGKVVFGFRGTSSFYQKGNAAVKNGAAAVVIANNQDGVINMNLEGYNGPAPCVSILRADAMEIIKASKAVTDASGNVLYYTGKITISDQLGAGNYYSEYYTMSNFSSWGVPGSLEMKPEITAPGGSIYSVNGATASGKDYELMSGTSMASPQVAGMAAVLGQYIRENDLTTKTGFTARQLINALLMSTAEPLLDKNVEYYYSVLNQGAGLANVADAISAETLVMMNADATASYKDGKIKVELGDDPMREGKYTFSFNLTNFGDEKKAYTFDADFFTQDIFADSGMTFLDTWTAPLDASVTFSSDGKIAEGPNYDFNGDGYVNDDDAESILDYVTGGIDTFANIANADFDGDGEITSHDAYLFLLNEKTAEADLVLEPGETATVRVKVVLNDIDDYDDNGAYVEGYVFVNELATDDVIAQSYSIPVLGYYGSWSEPSMFDVGSYIEYAYGLENRVPYLYAANGKSSLYANSITINYVGDDNTYYFGGNPVFDEDEYHEERNAMNSADKLAKLNFALIRNGKLTGGIFDEEGNAVAASDQKETLGAFYYVNGGAWQYTGRSLSLDYSPANIAEGTRLCAAVIAAPEYYYVNNNGSVDDEALSGGSVFGIPFTVDNTAPEIIGEITCKDGVMDITAKDNQYIAGIFVYDEEGTQVAAIGPDLQAEAGETMDLFVGVGEATRFIVEIYDYAANCSAYKINLNAGETEEEVSITLDKSSVTLLKNDSTKLTATVGPFGIADDAVIWTSDNESVATVNANGIVTGVGNGTCVITAAAHADPTKTAQCVVTVESVDIAVKGALQDEDGNPILFTWDLANDSTWKRGKDLPSAIAAFTWNEDPFDASGVDYGYLIDGESNFYKIDMATGKAVEEAGENEFGAPMQDIAIPYYYNAANSAERIFGVYGSYVIFSDGMANTFSTGWNLASYLDTYTGSKEFTALAWIGLDNEDGVYSDVLMAMTDNGAVWFLYYDGTSSIGLGYAQTGASALKWVNSDGLYLSSMVWGTDRENIYLSHFNGTTNELYAIDGTVKEMPIKYLGNVGEDVWPAAIYEVTSSAGSNDYDCAVKASVVAEVESQSIVLPAAAEGSLNAVKSSAVPAASVNKGAVNGAVVADDADDSDMIVIDVTAFDHDNENVASNNGYYTVKYNSNMLTYAGTDCYAQHASINVTETNGLGVIKVAFADLEGFEADENIFSVYFMPQKAGDTNVKVEAIEVNDKTDVNASSIVTVNADTPELVRLEGHSRTETAAAISSAAYDFADTVILANGDNYADALAGAPLAYAMNAPILLVRNNKAIDDATLAEMERLGARKIVILGGEVAVSASVVDQLKRAGYTSIERVAGHSRYDTAVAIAEKLEKVNGSVSDTVFFACANNYPDALAISNVAAIMGAPILYVGSNGDLRSSEDYLKNNSVKTAYILGGEVAVAKAAEGKIAAYGAAVERIAGYSRYDTCLAINKTFDDILYGSEICVATGKDFPDALAGGVYAARVASPMLLVDNKALSDAQTAYIAGRTPTKVVVFGGNVAVSDAIANAIVDVIVEAMEA